MIPDKPLALTLPANDDLLLDDIQLFEPDGFSIKGFKAFMARYSNWTPAQVGQMTRAEMWKVTRQIIEQLNENAVPKAPAASS